MMHFTNSKIRETKKDLNNERLINKLITTE